MKQPLFKFGDKVCRLDKRKAFVISKIVFCSDAKTYEYHDDEDNWEYEEHIKPYQEPQKKKLYAYYLIDSFDTVIHKKSENHNDPRPMQRISDYDIEYPEKDNA